MIRDYSALMSAAVDLQWFGGYLTTEDQKKKREVESHFNSIRNMFVYEALKSELDPDSVKQSIFSELDDISDLQPEWTDTINFVRHELASKIDKESRKNPTLRKFIHWSPAIIGVILIGTYFGVRFVTAVEINQPVETRIGLTQRAEAVSKAIRYDEWMSSHVRRGGFLKPIILWPIEPNETELRGASELFSLSLQGREKLVQDGYDCDNVNQNTTQQISDKEMDLVRRVSEQLTSGQVKWVDPPVMTVLQIIEQSLSCKKA